MNANNIQNTSTTAISDRTDDLFVLCQGDLAKLTNSEADSTMQCRCRLLLDRYAGCAKFCGRGLEFETRPPELTCRLPVQRGKYGQKQSHYEATHARFSINRIIYLKPCRFARYHIIFFLNLLAPSEQIICHRVIAVLIRAHALSKTFGSRLTAITVPTKSNIGMDIRHHMHQRPNAMNKCSV
jgi:hypothetical protein